MPRVIGITGLAGSGKSSAASLLSIHHGFKLVKFADPLKDMLRAIGLGPAEIEGHKKGLPSRLLGGKSPRYAMQTLGTDWGRAMISDDLWTYIWKSRAKQFLLDGTPVVCDDCRFENEATVIRDLGGELWNIKRPQAGRLGATGGLPGHESESGQAARYAKHQIQNSGTLDELLAKVTELMSKP
jgi:hypothetical protein